jgi:hypothetical protein
MARKHGQRAAHFLSHRLSSISSPKPSKEVTAPAEHMALRQQFVMAAMQGLRADAVLIDHLDHEAEWVASRAQRIADSTLAEEARTRGGP